MKRFASILMIMILLVTVGLEASADSHYQYKVEKVKNLPKELSTTPFATTEGQPGITISINASRSITRNYSFTMNGGIKSNDINAAIGWSKSTSDSTSVSNGGSWKVPSKANGKAVKKGILKGYFYYDRVEYKVLRRTVTISHAGRGGTRVRYGKWEVYKTGCIAKKVRPYDALYKYEYQYK